LAPPRDDDDGDDDGDQGPPGSFGDLSSVVVLGRVVRAGDELRLPALCGRACASSYVHGNERQELTWTTNRC
jgi:hypothetical protein